MEITHEYDSETQKLINKLQERITSIGKRYESKLKPKTAKECLELSRPGYEEYLLKEYREEIRLYQKMLEEIYLKSVPRIIVKTE